MRCGRKAGSSHAPCESPRTLCRTSCLHISPCASDICLCVPACTPRDDELSDHLEDVLDLKDMDLLRAGSRLGLS